MGYHPCTIFLIAVLLEPTQYSPKSCWPHEVAFASLAFFNQLAVPLYMLPMTLAVLVMVNAGGQLHPVSSTSSWPPRGGDGRQVWETWKWTCTEMTTMKEMDRASCICHLFYVQHIYSQPSCLLRWRKLAIANRLLHVQSHCMYSTLAHDWVPNCVPLRERYRDLGGEGVGLKRLFARSTHHKCKVPYGHSPWVLDAVSFYLRPYFEACLIEN